MVFYSVPYQEVIRYLKSNLYSGIRDFDVPKFRKEYGRNLIPEKKKTPEYILFLKQFKNYLFYLIFIASAFSFFLGKIFDGFFIMTVVLIAGTAAYFQERGVGKILEELKKIVKVKAVVLRDGKKLEVESEELVPGDIVFLSAGSKAPADVRIIDSQNLEVNEAALTGEWLPSKKHNHPLPENTVLADRENMVYMGTIIEGGSGKGVVVSTGRHTELGKIAISLQEEKDRKTLLEKKLMGFSKHYGLFVLFVLIVVFILGIKRGILVIELFTIIIATGVSAMPEGLLPAMTVVLVLGMKRILREKGLVRKLSILETLGSVEIILSDKTATLTEGEMRVARVLPAGEIFNLKERSHNLCLEIAAFANSAFSENYGEGLKKWRVVGSPTDKAMYLAVAEAGINVEKLKREAEKIDNVPFSSDNKYQASLYKTKKDIKMLYVAGAPEKVLEISRRVKINGKNEELNKEKQELIYKKLDSLAGEGFRVLAVGYRIIKAKKRLKKIEQYIEDITFAGFLVLKDPLRKEAKKAISLCRKMGIEPVIVSGDHLLTTQKIAQELGLEVKEGGFMEAKELEKLSQEELDSKIENIKVFARIDPAHKLKIVETWQKKGKIIAMTGDGINDAAALKRADVGLALGSGTDLAKESSDIILLDNNFLTIIKAIEEGRSIFRKIRNITSYLVSVNFSELGFIVISVVFGFPLMLLPTQVLWINIIESSLPTIGLTLEKREEEVLGEKPRSQKEKILSNSVRLWMIAIAFVTIFVEFLFFAGYLKAGFSPERARTFILIVTSLETLYLAYAHRSLYHSVLRKDIFSNTYLNGAVLLSVFFLIIGVYAPLFQNFLHTVSLGLYDWGLIGLCVLIESVILEIAKIKIFAKK